jgi:hypothetical protein
VPGADAPFRQDGRRRDNSYATRRRSVPTSNRLGAPRLWFSSAIVALSYPQVPEMGEVLPLLYLHGLSGNDFGPALEQEAIPAVATAQRAVNASFKPSV